MKTMKTLFTLVIVVAAGLLLKNKFSQKSLLMEKKFVELSDIFNVKPAKKPETQSEVYKKIIEKNKQNTSILLEVRS